MFSKVSAVIGFVIFMVNVFTEVWKTLYAAMREDLMEVRVRSNRKLPYG
jgi:hypothetical protein